jgi:nucleoid DNA-binding protein
VTRQELCAARGLTLEALGERAGVLPATVAEIDAGTLRANQFLLRRLADVLGLTPGALRDALSAARRARALDSVLAALTEALGESRTVTLTRFGTFDVRPIGARRVRALRGCGRAKPCPPCTAGCAARRAVPRAEVGAAGRPPRLSSPRRDGAESGPFRGQEAPAEPWHWRRTLVTPSGRRHAASSAPASRRPPAGTHHRLV